MIGRYFRIVFLIFVLLKSFAFKAQSNQEFEIKGKIFDKELKQPIEYATILIVNAATNKPVKGTTSDANGAFTLTSNSSNFYIEVDFIGYKKLTINNIDKSKPYINLQTINLEQDAQNLSEVVVVGTKSTTEFRLDKRVFNVGSDLASSGASALEVLNNVPSVNVDIEGKISLRGSQGVQILINGKPSVLASGDGNNALGTITAEMIDKVEVITNPSAKYEASGTSGILNIVLKKDQKKGLNGSATLNVGTPDTHSFGLSVNRRTEHLNIFSQIGFGKRTFPNTNETSNFNKETGVLLKSKGYSEMHEKFYNFLLDSDFILNKNNVITLSVNYAFEKEDTPGTNNYTRYNSGNVLVDQWKRTELTLADNPKWQYELQYKKDFEDHKEHDLLFSAMGSSFIKYSESNFKDVVSLGVNEENSEDQNLTDFGRTEYTFKLDYTKPFSEKYTLETGAQYLIQDVFNDYEVLNYENNTWISNADLTNVFNYNQNVLGAYGTFSYEGDYWGLKLGARLENTYLKTELENTNEKRTQNYSNFFPSLHTSYKINEVFSFQAGYSKRINRPGLWDLNPFSVIRDNFNISTGNPDLTPEYTDSYELTTILKFDKISLNFGTYYRNTTNVIEDVISYNNNVSTRKPLNLGTNSTTGIEFNGKYNPAKWVTVSADANFNFFNRIGEYEGTDFDFSSTIWSSKLNSKFKLPADIDVEFTGNYRSAYKGVLSDRGDEAYLDFGIRKKIIKGKVIVNLSVQDLFESRNYESLTDQPTYNISRSGSRGRFVMFGVSYGFGKGEAMEFSGQRRRM